MFREVTTPIRTNAILIGEAELFGELPGSYSLDSVAGAPGSVAELLLHDR